MNDQSEKFVKMARDYCAWAEGEPSTPEEGVKKAIFLIVSLYSSALALPKDGCGEEIDALELTDKDWQSVFNRFGSLPFNYYTVSFSPARIDEEPVTGDIADEYIER